MQMIKLAIVALTLIFAPAAAFSDTDAVEYQILDRPFLELLGFLEGPDGYDDLTGFTNRRPVKPVSQMTINEVLSFQRMLRQNGTKSSAMGRYQFVYKTLEYLTRIHDIDRNLLFNKDMQDHLTRIEMRRCGFYDPEISIRKLGNCLARVWAALPLLSGPHRGESRYRKTGINLAQTTPEVIEAILRNRITEYRPQTYPLRRPWRKNRPGFNSISESFPVYRAVLQSIPTGFISPQPLAPERSPIPTLRPE